MRDYIEERAEEIGSYIVDSGETVRQTARKFGVSKSTVHKDITERLVRINPMLAARARVVLDANKAERHIRGGLATRDKYMHMEDHAGEQTRKHTKESLSYCDGRR